MSGGPRRDSRCSRKGPTNGLRPVRRAPASVLFPEHEAGEVPASRLGGTLVLDEKSCIRLRTGGRGPGEMVSCSPELAPRARGGRILVPDGRGRRGSARR